MSGTSGLWLPWLSERGRPPLTGLTRGDGPLPLASRREGEASLPRAGDLVGDGSCRCGDEERTAKSPSSKLAALMRNADSNGAPSGPSSHTTKRALGLGRCCDGLRVGGGLGRSISVPVLPAPLVGLVAACAQARSPQPGARPEAPPEQSARGRTPRRAPTVSGTFSLSLASTIRALPTQSVFVRRAAGQP